MSRYRTIKHCLLSITAVLMMICAGIDLTVDLFRMIPYVTGGIASLRISKTVYLLYAAASLIQAVCFWQAGLHTILNPEKGYHITGSVDEAHAAVIMSIISGILGILYAIELRETGTPFLIGGSIRLLLAAELMSIRRQV